MIHVRGGNWEPAYKIALELFESPSIEEIQNLEVDEFDNFHFLYKGYRVSVNYWGSVRVADDNGMVAVREKRVGKLRRKLRRLAKAQGVVV